MNLRSERLRGWIWQAALLAAVACAVAWLVGNTLDNLAARGIQVGFGFLGQEAGFAIAQTPVPYSPGDTYARALVTGLANTLIVSVIGIIAATLLGTAIGVARLAGNRLLAGLAGAYVEAVRNVPLLLQLFVWYGILTEWLPPVRQAISLGGVVVMSQRGLRFAWPQAHAGWLAAGLALLLAIVLAFAWRRHAERRRRDTGSAPPVLAVATGLIVGLPVVAWGLAGAPLAIEYPMLRGFDYRGGIAVSPEFAALVIGLSTYTAGFIAEVVRAGLQSVDRGQVDAAKALGLSAGQRLRLVVMPQALRVIVPPLTNQYLNLTKNSSLAVAIGYPDLVSVANTTMNQTGQAIEAMVIVMAVYLTISLAIAFAMNLFEARTRLVER
ncbi:MAG: ABC transporter permease subunit [Burkholderiaceae bacterium]|nr:ABC transporter permease subunit [Burkholderiaceae bacterium]